MTNQFWYVLFIGREKRNSGNCACVCRSTGHFYQNRLTWMILIVDDSTLVFNSAGNENQFKKLCVIWSFLWDDQFSYVFFCVRERKHASVMVLRTNDSINHRRFRSKNWPVENGNLGTGNTHIHTKLNFWSRLTEMGCLFPISHLIISQKYKMPIKCRVCRKVVVSRSSSSITTEMVPITVIDITLITIIQFRAVVTINRPNHRYI